MIIRSIQFLSPILSTLAVSLVFLLQSVIAKANHCESHPIGQDVLLKTEVQGFAPSIHGVAGKWMDLPVFKVGKVLHCSPDDLIEVKWSHRAQAFGVFRSIEDAPAQVLPEKDLWFSVLRSQGFFPGVKVLASLDDYGVFREFSIGVIEKIYSNAFIDRTREDRVVALVQMSLLDGVRVRQGKEGVQARTFFGSQLERVGKRVTINPMQTFDPLLEFETLQSLTRKLD